MSAAQPMDNVTRESLYLRDRSTLTPAQARRIRHRQGVALRDTGTARYGRLRRRYERKTRRDLPLWAQAGVNPFLALVARGRLRRSGRAA